MQTGKLLKGKVVVVTGASRGLGKAMADAFELEGAKVVRASRQTNPALDVGSEKSVLDFFSWLDNAHGRIDAIVNNAGVGVFKPITDVTLDDWQQTLSTNLTGTFLCSREAFKRMKAQGSGGRIVNIGSISDYLTLEQNGAYAASKFGVRGLTGVLNEEGKRFGIKASLVSPGAVYTEIWKGREGFDSRDMLQPRDVARAVLTILSAGDHVRIDELKLMPPKGVL